jgi:hypothetical protein
VQVSKIQIASVVASVFSNTSVSENKVWKSIDHEWTPFVCLSLVIPQIHIWFVLESWAGCAFLVPFVCTQVVELLQASWMCHMCVT